jgi:hypothetical protein
MPTALVFRREGLGCHLITDGLDTILPVMGKGHRTEQLPMNGTWYLHADGDDHVCRELSFSDRLLQTYQVNCARLRSCNLKPAARGAETPGDSGT